MARQKTATTAAADPAECSTDAFDPEQVRDLRGKPAEVEGVFEIFRVLGDDTRTKICYLLQHAELCVHDLAQLLGASPSSVSHHLRHLRSNRLVKTRRAGKIVYYSLDDAHVSQLLSQAREHYLER